MILNRTGYIVSALIIAAFSACNREHPGFTKAESGLYYKFNEQNENAPKVMTGDEVTVSLKMSTGDTVFLSTDRDTLLSEQITVEESIYPGDIFAALRMMSKGDSATFILNGNDLFLNFFRMERLPDYMKDSAEVFLNIRIKELLPRAESEKKTQAMLEAREKMLQELKRSEPERIAAFLRENDLSAKFRKSGLYYIETLAGKGSPITKGRSVTVHYVAKLADGKIIETSLREEAMKSGIFDSLFEYTPFTFVMGDSSTVTGWEEGISYMRKGGKAILVVPSALAYGEEGLEDIIPPYSPVIYEIEVLEVK
jgi:FKBP-type peptidyl-prolyl cis-trans isomerase FkpA